MRTENRPAPVSQYDALIVDADTGDILTVAELARQLANTDVVVTGGEYHGHHASHLLQARLQQALYRHNPPRQILSMEQFNLNHQDALDAYLAGQTGETEMIEDADAWENYKGSYRPWWNLPENTSCRLSRLTPPRRISCAVSAVRVRTI